MPTRKLEPLFAALAALLVLLVAMLARPGIAAGQADNPSCRITGRDNRTGAPIWECGGNGSPAASGGVTSSRSPGPVCTYRPATAGEVIGIANQQPEPGIDVNAPTPPTDINGRPHQLTIRTCNGFGTLVLVDLTITDADLAAIAGAQVIGSLQTPQVLFPDPTPQGWFWVKASVDFRVEPANVELIVITAEAGGLWATATARPIDVEFTSGDPRGVPTDQCSVAGLTARYVRSTPGECSYAYQNSSSIVPGNQFEASITVTWEITWIGSSGASANLGRFPVTGTSRIAIAEAKALTCAGNGPCTTP
jgi:hypothetical protein